MPAGAVDPVVARPLTRHHGAHGLDRRDLPKVIFRLEVAVDLRGPVRERPQQRGAMRDRLVARHVGRAGEPRHRTHAELHRKASRVALIRASAARSASGAPASMARWRPARASWKPSTLADSASRFARKLSVHISGPPAAMPGVSRTPQAASSSADGPTRPAPTPR